MAHHLVGTTEIAELLGVTRQRVHQLASSPDFPRPEIELSAGKIWTREAIEGWLDSRRDRFSGPKPIACSFCGKQETEVQKLVSGPKAIEICNECIDLAAEIVLSECHGEGLLRVPAYYFKTTIRR